MSDDTRAWLILANAYLRSAEYSNLADRYGTAAAIAQQPASALMAAGLAATKAEAIASPDVGRLDDGLRWQAETGHSLLTVASEAYPELLRQLPDAPLLLYVNGNPGLLQAPCLAMVGSRNPTHGGTRNAFEFARHLGSSGFTIVSGLAQGIDAAAHRGALQAAAGTIALLGHGIDRVYPASNRELAHEIAAAGALISEYPLGTPPDKRHFPERNRLISGLCLGTVVVEAARRSGSLITARLAAEQGREVFALPGSIHNPLARGCHLLIQQGAKLVETAADIVAELAPLSGHLLQAAAAPQPHPDSVDCEDREYVELKKYLGHDPVTADELAEHSGLTIDQVSSMLLILELHGDVESLSGGRYSLLS